jgi:uncharacterized delta-60 repeat protein
MKNFTLSADKLYRPLFWALLIFAGIFPKTINAQLMGDLDLTFGTGGKVITMVGPGHDLGRDVFLQSDGKIVLVGCYHNGTNYDYIATRYLSTGVIDSTFGINGIAKVPVGTSDDIAFTGLFLSDGRIIIAGDVKSGTQFDFGIVSLLNDGSLDTSFGGGDGMAVFPLGLSNDYSRSIALQADGKMVLTGLTLRTTGDYDVGTIRINPDGSIDSTFGLTGKVITTIGAYNDYGWAVAIQADQKIVITGKAFNGTDDDVLLLRYNTDGTLDAGFGTNGIVVTTTAPLFELGQYVLVQPDGKIVVSGYRGDGTMDDVLLLRYNTDGTLDNTFGVGGVVVTSVGPFTDYSFSIKRQTDGKIISVGRTSDGTQSDFLIIRYLPNGNIDSTFGTNGIVITPMGNNNDYGYSSAIQPDGRLIVAGYGDQGTHRDLAIARYWNCEMPVIASQPVSQEVCSGINVVFSVYGTGSLPLNVQWYYNNHLIPGANSVNYTVQHAASDNVGNFWCVVSNACGTDTSEVASLYVNPIPFGASTFYLCDGDSIFLFGDYIKIPGVYTDTMQTLAGCDSILQATVVASFSQTYFVDMAICQEDSIFLQSQWQNQPGTYVDTLVSAMGCDSIVYTELSLTPGYFINQTVIICNGDSALLAGHWQTTAGDYYDSLSTNAGCDSILLSELIIENEPNAGIGSQDTVCVFETSDLYTFLIPPYDAGGIWYDDSLSGALSGSLFNASLVVPGFYGFTYQVEGDVCPDAQANVLLIVDYCTNINSSEVFDLLIYPNPAQQNLILETKGNHEKISLAIINSEGKQIIAVDQDIWERLEISLGGLSPGIYLLRIEKNNQYQSVRFIKE